MNSPNEANSPRSPAEESPRRGTNPSPRGRGRGRGGPTMGVPGLSAFTAYTRPPPPAQPPSGGGYAGAQPPALAMGVLASGAGVVAAAPGVGNPAARKRGRDGASSSAEGAVNPVICSLCGKPFNTPKALFGHMRSHPGRGWRGAHPPPTFRADEEFADLRVGAAEEEDPGNYKLPDLNNPPPPEDEK